MLSVRQLAGRVIDLTPNIPDEAKVVLEQIDAPGGLADFLAANLPLPSDEKQELLETLDVPTRLRRIAEILNAQLEVLELSNKIQTEVRQKMEKSQREYFLNEQMKAIQRELGRGDDRMAEINELRRRIDDAGMPELVLRQVTRELDRLANIPAASPEHTVIRTYVDLMSELPWSKSTTDKLDIRRARRVLDEDHYDLDEIKKRILEYLAVRKLKPDTKGPILCFVGPPGVGKTSLGRSIARALGRNFIRISLGGMRDEAEIRGHRRTYIGAMPGRIIQEIRKSGANNPVFMLDEVDKIGQDFRGDPSSALLEVLDPAQNDTFSDHYVDAPFDLSKVMFIATANHMDPVPPALRDRMEVITLAGYTEREKLHIARKYLVPRQISENGLTRKRIRFSNDALVRIINDHTREAGVRNLERSVGAICRAVAARIAGGSRKVFAIDPAAVRRILGPQKYKPEQAELTHLTGVATGLAWTPVGGAILFVEATAMNGRGGLLLTGQIGDVMKESAQAALSYVKAHAVQLGLGEVDFTKIDVHVHVPAGAIPKDGPSAGVAILSAIVSLLRGEPIQKRMAMTGEITLRGQVLPVGGLKEKVLAAHQAGITTILLPRDNDKDVKSADVPKDVRDAVKLIYCSRMRDVIRHALALTPATRQKKTPAKKKAKRRTPRAKSAAARAER
jgi:ATP-dependent Lon protease